MHCSPDFGSDLGPDLGPHPGPYHGSHPGPDSVSLHPLGIHGVDRRVQVAHVL